MRERTFPELMAFYGQQQGAEKSDKPPVINRKTRRHEKKLMKKDAKKRG